MNANTTHQINGDNIIVTTEQQSTCPLAFHIRANHSDGKSFHEQSLTIGDVELNNIVTLEDAQKHLDTARQKCAETASKKAALAKIAASLQ